MSLGILILYHLNLSSQLPRIFKNFHIHVVSSKAANSNDTFQIVQWHRLRLILL